MRNLAGMSIACATAASHDLASPVDSPVSGWGEECRNPETSESREPLRAVSQTEPVGDSAREEVDVRRWMLRLGAGIALALLLSTAELIPPAPQACPGCAVLTHATPQCRTPVQGGYTC